MAEQILSIHLKRFRKFKENTLSSTKRNVLVGANNSGKTSILHALRLFFFALLARENGYEHPEHSEVMKHIVQPNFYRAAQKSKQMVIQRYLSDVCSALENWEGKGFHDPLRFITLHNQS